MANSYNTNQNNKIEYVAVLDLGSESMFAFFGKKDMTELKQIDLQDETKIKNWTKWNINDVNVYKNPDGTKSKRLRNKIAIATKRVDVIKDKESHAKILFNSDSYKKTIFQLFQEDSIDAVYEYMCNPKVIYAKGAKNILPKIEDKEKGKTAELEPDEYLKHLTTQVANNLILKSKQLNGIEPRAVKLVVTIPNIYSLTHAEELADFLKKHTLFGEVDYIYESDAVLFASLTSDFNSFEKGTKEILTKKFRPIKDCIEKHEKIYLISHDVGKGTTDLSLFSCFRQRQKNENKNIWINSRTGLTKAGNALDYIFVKLFEEKVLKVFYEQNRKQKKEKDTGFSFIEKKKYPIQNNINEHAQEVIFRIKKNIEHKGFILKKYRIPKQFYRNISDHSNKTFSSAKTNKDATILIENLHAVCEKIIESNISTGRISENDKDELIKELYMLFIKTTFKKNFFTITFPESVKQNIDDYVNEIGNTLPKILKHNAKQRAEYLNPGNSFKVSANTFVVISGQASQFKPLKKIITSAYYSNFRVKKGNLIFLEDNISKQICAVGGFLKEKTKGQHQLQNEDELLADYYLSNVGPGYMKLNYKELHEGKSITYDTDGEPILYYYSILDGKNENIIKQLFQGKNKNIDNYIAFIRGFSSNGTYKVKYVSKEHFEINGEKIELGATVDNDESIYQNIWPEILIK